MKRKFFAFPQCLILTAVLCLLVLLLSGCGNNINTEQDDSSVSSAADTAAGTASTDSAIDNVYSGTEPSEADELSEVHEFSIYSNRASGTKFYQDLSSDTIFYSNIYDSGSLYKYDIASDSLTKLSDGIKNTLYISVYGDKVYFTGYDTGIWSVYSVSADGSDLTLEAENAMGGLLTDDYIYYHDFVDDFKQGICRRNISTGITEVLVSSDYYVSNMTMNIVGDSIYFHNGYDIFRYGISSGEITNITDYGTGKHGINKLQYVDGYLYYYTYEDVSSIKRMNTETYEEEEILVFNGGNFWYDAMMAASDCIVFTGSQYNALKEGEPEESFVRGTYKYTFETDSVTKIYDRGIGPVPCLADRFISASFAVETSGVDRIFLIDYDGNDVSDMYPKITSP